MTQADPFLSNANQGRDRSADWPWLLLLLILVIPLRGWLWNTEVLARDGVLFIGYALELEKLPWKEALLKNHQHPGYPLSIWATSIPVRHWFGPANSFTMQLSAQLASNLAAVLLVFPMYFLGKFFFERRIAFWGTLLFQYLPVSGQVLSDGLSEPLFLLLTSSAFLAALWGLRRQSVVLFAVSGVFSGLAYMTRPEGVAVPIAVLLTLAASLLIPAWKRSWHTTSRCGLALIVASVAVGSLYFGYTGCFTNKPTGRELIGDAVDQQVRAEPDEENEAAQAGSGGPLFGCLLASFTTKDGSLAARVSDGLAAYGKESMQIFHYAGLVPLIFGMFLRLPRLFKSPEVLVPSFFVILHSGVLVTMACKVGYLSNRHLLGVALWGTFFTAAGFCDVPGRLWSLWSGRPFAALVGDRRIARVSLALLCAFVAACLPRTVQKLHVAQAGNHLAGQWLAQHAGKEDVINDDHHWSSYYANQNFERVSHPTAGEPRCYVVITRSKDPKAAAQQRKLEDDLRAVKGHDVPFHWPVDKPQDQARIVIHAIPRKP